MKTYPVHTPVSAITFFDRSTKVVFQCSHDDHSDTQVWCSKDPYSSSWFPAGPIAKDCNCKASEMWTVEPYKS